MIKIVRFETVAATEDALNKLEGEGWRVVGTGPDYVLMSDAPRARRMGHRALQSDDGVAYRSLLRENMDLSRECDALRRRLKSHEDETSTQHWDGLQRSRNRYKKGAEELFEALCWASAARDFSPGDENVPAGEAREGWERGPAKAMAEYQEALRLEREENRER